MSRNATPSSFGWDFQVNAAIVLMLENIKLVKSGVIRLEAEHFMQSEILFSAKEKESLGIPLTDW